MTKPTFWCIVSLCFAVLTADASGETSNGWSAGPDEDATMQVGQRFVCRGPECGLHELTCVHAKAPPRPAGARWLKVADVTNDAVWPWEAVEAWLATKLVEISDNPIAASSLPAGPWASRDDPVTFEIGDRGFARRIYRPNGVLRDISVPIWFWTSGGRLSTLFCAIEGASLGDVREPIHRLLDDLHPGDPVRDDIPTRF